MLMGCSIWIWGTLPLKLTVRKPKPLIRTSQFSCTTIRMSTDACEKTHLAVAVPPARVQWLCLCQSQGRPICASRSSLCHPGISRFYRGLSSVSCDALN